MFLLIICILGLTFVKRKIAGSLEVYPLSEPASVMGSFLSRLVHTPFRPLYQRRIDAPSVGFEYDRRNLATPVDLHARLAVLEKDSQDAHVEIAQKEAIIQYLLYRNVSSSNSEGDMRQLVLNLQTTIIDLLEDSKDLRDKCHEIQNSILPFAAPNVLAKATASNSTGSSTCCKESDGEVASPKELINLIDFDDESGGIDTIKKDLSSTICQENTSHEVDHIPETESDAGLSDPYLSGIPDMGYIHHFVHDNGEIRKAKAQPQIAVKVFPSMVLSLQLLITTVWKLEREPGLQNSTARLLKKYEKPELSTDSDSSALEPLSLSSDPTSTSSSTKATPAEERKVLVTPHDLAQYSDSELANYTAQLWDEVRETHALHKGKKNNSGLFIPKTFVQGLPTLETKDQIPVRNTTTALELRWSVSEVFESQSERRQALSINRHNANLGARDIPRPDLFTYGIRYVPNTHQRDTYRTIIISCLPANLTIARLLEKVRGGMVIDAKLLDTIKLTRSKSALVIFLHEHSAAAYVDHAKSNPIIFDGVAAQVTVVCTPTWPIPPNLQNQIYQQARTRCLEVHNFPSSIRSSAVKTELMDSPVMTSNSLASMQMSKNGVLSLHFASIKAAGAAAAIFERALRYSKCVVKFRLDPCVQPLSTLLVHHSIDPDLNKAITVTAAPNSPDATTAIDPSLIDQSCRLPKIEWEKEADLSRGRGFHPEEEC